MTKQLINKRVSLPAAIVLGGLLFLLGLALDGGIGPAQAQTKKSVTLGLSSAKVLDVLGTPEKINYDSDIQIWFYRSNEGALKKRIHLNQGVVVKIF